MLVLSANLGDSIYIDNGRIVMTVVKAGRGQIRLMFEAPKDVVIDRKSVHLDKLRERCEQKAGGTA
jgi:carbon storage regulator CsrA